MKTDNILLNFLFKNIIQNVQYSIYCVSVLCLVA